MEILINGVPHEHCLPRYSGKFVTVGVDPSKSHAALVVGDEYSEFYDYIEILGGGSDIDVYDLCAFTREHLRNIFFGCTIIKVGVEDPITKKRKDKNGKWVIPGMETHENRLKLSAVFDNYMFLFRDLAGFNPERVNNQAWKKAILPAGYNTKEHDKGSYDWLNSFSNRFAGTNDNVTDAACILMYIRKDAKDIRTQRVGMAEMPKWDFDYSITSTLVEGIHYQYNIEMDFKSNLTFVANRADGEIRWLDVDVSNIPIPEFYKETCLYEPAGEVLYVAVQRRE